MEKVQNLNENALENVVGGAGQNSEIDRDRKSLESLSDAALKPAQQLTEAARKQAERQGRLVN